jgi:hypothetical protein
MRPKQHKVSRQRATECTCEGVKGMKFEKFNVFVVITTLVVLAGIVFTALSGLHIKSRQSAPYKHPCIVVKVDNRGCETVIEMRTLVEARQNGGFTD